MNIENKEVGARIKNIRLSSGWTLEELGEKLDTSKVTVFNWEKGRNKPNKENLKRIAELGDISVNELLYGSEMKFEEFSRKVYQGDKNLVSWCQKVLTDYFFKDTKEGTMDKPLSNKKELNLLIAFNIMDILFEKDEYPTFKTFKEEFFPIIWDFFTNKEFEEYLNALYLYYIEDEIALYKLDSTLNEILQNISLENKSVYLLNIRELIKSTIDQVNYSNFHVKKFTRHTKDQSRIPVITMNEYEQIIKGLNTSLKYIDNLIEKEIIN